MVLQFLKATDTFLTFKVKYPNDLPEETRRVRIEDIQDEFPEISDDFQIKEEDYDYFMKRSEVFAFFDKDGVLHYMMPKNFICKEIIYEGTKNIPKGFYSVGGGFTDYKFGYLLTDAIRAFLDNKEATISEFRITQANQTLLKPTEAGSYKLILNERDLQRIRDRSRQYIEEGKTNAKHSIIDFFVSRFPELSNFDDNLNVLTSTKKALIKSLDETIVDKLTPKELKQVESFYMKILERKITKKPFIERNVLKLKEITLDNLLVDFEKKLEKKTSESTWQRFFEQNIFIFDSRYIDFVPKQNLKTGKTSMPDFLVYDIYGFVDIYEIKKPSTKLLKYDTSHNNYYWSTEMAAAISQLEKYVFLASAQALSIERDIKVERGHCVTVVRPCGILVVGHSKELENDSMKQDFRILRNSLKNVGIVLYDEIYESLKNLRKKIESESSEGGSYA